MSLNLLEYDPFHHPENETSRPLPLVAYLPQRVLLLDAILDTEWNASHNHGARADEKRSKRHSNQLKPIEIVS
jgi:hypothetical protein